MSPRSLPKRLDGVSGVVSKVSALYLLETHSEIITTGFLMQKEKKKLCFYRNTKNYVHSHGSQAVTSGLYRKNHWEMAQGISRQINDKLGLKLGLCWEVGG